MLHFWLSFLLQAHKDNGSFWLFQNALSVRTLPFFFFFLKDISLDCVWDSFHVSGAVEKVRIPHPCYLVLLTGEGRFFCFKFFFFFSSRDSLTSAAAFCAGASSLQEPERLL